MIGLRKGERNRDYNKIAKDEDTWVSIDPNGGSHRFGIVLAPSRPDASLTINLLVELVVAGKWQGCSGLNSPKRISIGFDGITATR
jgi:hypothetical protein